MQFEEFDKRIKEAADNHHPAYNEKAWGKMADLLDKHLPEKDDRRRRSIFFILFPLLLAVGSWLVISQFSNDKKKATGENDSTVVTANSSANSIAVSEQDKRTEALPVRPDPTQEPTDGAATANNPDQSNVPVQADGMRTPAGNTDQQFEATVAKPSLKKKKNIQPVADRPTNTTVPDKLIAGDLPASSEVITKTQGTTDKPTNEKTATVQPPAVLNTTDSKPESQKEVTATTDKKNEAPVEKAIAEKKKNNPKRNNSFFISLSAGPDVSSIGTDRPGKTKLLAGVGLGYTFKNRLTVRTGFYSARKIYSAGKDDYKPAATPPNYYYLDKIDADCRVYEIPVSIAYRFGKPGKGNFFAGAGLSSYLMKKEDYVYLYKYPGNPPVTYTHDYSFKNENNHYFSVLGLSAGYERNISKTVSVMAEPYIKIPLSGVGNGNVKLNSAGVLFTVNVKPFQHTKDAKKLSLKPE